MMDKIRSPGMPVITRTVSTMQRSVVTIKATAFDRSGHAIARNAIQEAKEIEFINSKFKICASPSKLLLFDSLSIRYYVHSLTSSIGHFVRYR